MKYEYYMNEQRVRCHRIKAPLLPHVNLTFRACQWVLNDIERADWRADHPP
jgi:hypothetical protein